MKVSVIPKAVSDKIKEKKEMFENYKVFNYELAGRPLTIETG